MTVDRPRAARPGWPTRVEAYEDALRSIARAAAAVRRDDEPALTLLVEVERQVGALVAAGYTLRPLDPGRRPLTA